MEWKFNSKFYCLNILGEHLSKFENKEPPIEF